MELSRFLEVMGIMENEKLEITVASNETRATKNNGEMVLIKDTAGASYTIFKNVASKTPGKWEALQNIKAGEKVLMEWTVKYYFDKNTNPPTPKTINQIQHVSLMGAGAPAGPVMHTTDAKGSSHPARVSEDRNVSINKSVAHKDAVTIVAALVGANGGADAEKANDLIDYFYAKNYARLQMEDPLKGDEGEDADATSSDIPGPEEME